MLFLSNARFLKVIWIAFCATRAELDAVEAGSTTCENAMTVITTCESNYGKV